MLKRMVIDVMFRCIFAGIVSSIPEMIKEIYENAFVNVRSGQMTNSLIFVGVLILAVLVIVYFTTFVEQAQYKIPIQYTKIAQGAPSSSYLPLKVNPAGVIPVIFASSITAAPAAIFQVISAMGYNAGWVKTAQAMLATNTPTGVAMYALLIILFTFFYTFVQINPEKTAEAFFEFEGLPAYHTGDVGTMTGEGLLLYGGRMDFQIKFNGYRIELEDVSQNLNKSRYIESAVAVPRYNKDHKVQNLLAYVILKDGVREQFERDIDITKAIKEDLTDIMMSYMMPSKFLYRDSLPLTPNGKIDIKGLINEVNQR